MNWIIWLFPVLCTVHNIDEGLALPDYADARERGLLAKKRVFLGLLIFLTLLAYGVTALYAFKEAPIFGYIYFGYVGAMLINAFIPHITGSIAAKKAVPGLVTAIINAIVFGYILVRAVLLEAISLQTLFYSTVAVGGAVLCLILFCFGSFRRSKQSENT